MKESYRFYQNKACEYFPCHPVDDPDSFNCLFCYCPLYLQEKCLGSPEWILSGKGQKIKDCSNCMVVHRPEMYDKVLAQLCRQDFTVSVNVWNFRNEIWRRMAQIASWDQMEAELFWQHRGAAISSVTNMMEKHKYLYRVTIKLQPFDAACVQNDHFSFGKQEIFCTVLERIDRSKITEGYLYAFHAPDFPVEEVSSLLSQYYLETFQIACMDVVREWVRDYLARKHSVTSPHYCSDSFGPGYYGMELSAVEKLTDVMDPADAGISCEDGMLQPMMSLVGLYLISTEDILSDCGDCAGCIGQKEGCRFCANYVKRS